MGWTTSNTYFDNGQLAKVTRTDGTKSFVIEDNSYDNAGNLIQKITNDGATTTTYSPDATGRVASETLDPAGLNRTTARTFDAEDRITTVTVTGGGKTESVDTAYDIVGNIKRLTVHDGAQDKITTWTYDKRGLPTSMTDPLGNATPDPLDGTTYYVNDEAGHQITVMSPAVPTESGVEGAAPQTLAAITRTGYNTFGEAVSAQDANGNSTLTGYDKAGRPVSTTAPAYTPPGSGTALQPVTTTAYDSMGRVIDETDAFGAHTTHTWDQLGHPKSMTAPGAATTTFTVDVLGDVLAVVSPTGARTESTWDWMGRKATATRIERYPSAAALVTTYTYGSGGWLTQQRSPAGVTAGSTYNPAGEVATATDGAGNITRFTYDLKGRQVRVDNADNTARTTSYSATGNTLITTDLDHTGAVLRTASNSYDLADRRTTSTDALGHTTTWTRDALGAVTQQVEPLSGSASITTTYAHDPRGNTTRFTDGRGNAFRTTWNSWNLIESRIEPSTPAHPALSDRTWTTAYDAAGRPATVTAPGAVVTTSTYDVRGNLTGQGGTGADAPTAARSFTYDTDNRMLTANVPTAADSFTYNDRGNLLTTTGPSGAATFGYDTDARMTSRADAAGTTTYAWDSAGRLASVIDAATGAAATRSYDSMNQLRTISYGTGAATRTRTYDDLHRLTGDTLTAPGGATEASISYGYDLTDRRTFRTTTGLAGAGNDTYDYDFAGRLTSWTHQTTAVAYTYDASGNRTGISGRTQAFDARNRITTATDTAGTTTYTWTPRGTLAATTGAKTRAATFDAFDQLITDTATPGNPNAAGTQAYTYDALARQITTAPASGATGPSATLSYSGTGHDLAADATATYALDPAGGLLGTRNGGSATHALADAHDDVVAAFTTTGATLSASVAYDPLGNTTATAGTMPGNTGYQGDWTDPATGQVDMWHRHYDPASSGFDNADPTWQDPDPASIAANRYAYGDGDPLDLTDPSGMGTRPDPSITTSGGDADTDPGTPAPSPPAFDPLRQLAVDRLGVAIEKLLTYAKIDQATAADLRPLVFATPTEMLRFDKLFDKGWRVVANMARDCFKQYNMPRCTTRHDIDPLRKYRWSHPCDELFSAKCLFALVGLVLEAVLTIATNRLIRIPGIGRGAEATEVKAGTSIKTKISWKVVSPSEAAPAAGTISDRVIATRVWFQKMGRQVGVRVETCGNSFTGDTLVLMADGTTKPIKDVELGDKVMATDPETGKTVPRNVIDLIRHDGLHTMIAVRLSDGSTINATDLHPFWVESRKAWVDAIDLQPGDILTTADGRRLTVERLGLSEQDLTAYNLTVAGLHTFYVLAEDAGPTATAVLVHNADCPPYLIRKFGSDGKRLRDIPPAPADQVDELATYLNYRSTGIVDSRGQMIYKRGRTYISQDVDSHTGGFWKMAKSPKALNSKNTRMGTYDFLLNRVGP
jgi:RHS repeat-associated protein